MGAKGGAGTVHGTTLGIFDRVLEHREDQSFLLPTRAAHLPVSRSREERVLIGAVDHENS